MESLEYYLLTETLPLLRDHIQQLKKTYQHLPNFTLIFRQLEQKFPKKEEIEDYENITYDLSSERSSSMPAFTNEQLNVQKQDDFDLEPDIVLEDIHISFLSDAKDQLAPADYYFLKASLQALLSNDESGAIWELEKGLFVCPEAWELVLFTQMLQYFNDYSLGQWIRNLSIFPINHLKANPKVRGYFQLASALQTFIDAPEEEKPEAFHKWLTYLPQNNISLFIFLMHYEKIVAPKVLMQLYELAHAHNSSEANLEALRILALYKNQAYEACYQAYQLLSPGSLKLHPLHELEVRMAHTRALYKMGNNGLAMLDLQEITHPDTVFDEMQDVFFEACFLLATLYFDSNQPEKAEKLYHQWIDLHTDYLSEDFGYSFFLLKGDIAASHNRDKEALTHYNAALKFKNSNELQERIAQL